MSTNPSPTSITVKFYGEEFPLTLSNVDEGGIEGFLRLDEARQATLEDLLDRPEEEYWYLDEQGERLEPEALFEASPWSMETAEGTVKLLRRYQNLETGEIRFNTQAGYGGELFRWLREPQ